MTVAAAWRNDQQEVSYLAGGDPNQSCQVDRGSREGRISYLVIGEDQRVGYNHILSSSSSEYDDFRNVIWSQGLTTART